MGYVGCDVWFGAYMVFEVGVPETIESVEPVWRIKEAKYACKEGVTRDILSLGRL